jgi:hypothetical protein
MFIVIHIATNYEADIFTAESVRLCISGTDRAIVAGPSKIVRDGRVEVRNEAGVVLWQFDLTRWDERELGPA